MTRREKQWGGILSTSLLDVTVPPKRCDHQFCNSIQVRHYGSFFLARRKESPNDVTTSYATASRCVNTVLFPWRDGQNHQMMWPPAMQQHPGASLRFHFMARRTKSPNDVTTRYARASRCITTVPFRGETGRITTCRYKILRPVSHPPIVHSFIGTARTSGAVPPCSKCITTVPISWRDGQNHQMMWPPAMQQHPGASLWFLFLGETDRITKWCDHQLCNSIQVRHYGSIPWRDRITKWCDHQLCNSIQVRHYGSFFLARRTESPNDVTTSYLGWPGCKIQHAVAAQRHWLDMSWTRSLKQEFVFCKSMAVSAPNTLF